MFHKFVELPRPIRSEPTAARIEMGDYGEGRVVQILRCATLDRVNI